MNEAIVEDSGIVKAVNGNRITVEIERGGGCKSCAMHGLCQKNIPAEFVLTSELDLTPGDRVLLDISPSIRAFASLLIFGLPIAFLFMGFMVASQWLNELISIFVGFAASALSFLIVRLMDSRYGKKLDIRIARTL
jgi:positive regulator of sigma E activity